MSVFVSLYVLGSRKWIGWPLHEIDSLDQSRRCDFTWKTVDFRAENNQCANLFGLQSICETTRNCNKRDSSYARARKLWPQSKAKSENTTKLLQMFEMQVAHVFARMRKITNTLGRVPADGWKEIPMQYRLQCARWTAKGIRLLCHFTAEMFAAEKEERQWVNNNASIANRAYDCVVFIRSSNRINDVQFTRIKIRIDGLPSVCSFACTDFRNSINCKTIWKSASDRRCTVCCVQIWSHSSKQF